MALNPDGLTYKQLADLIRGYYPDQYEYTEDEALVNQFKDNPDIDLDWDNIINEPTFMEKRFLPIKRELINAKHQALPAMHALVNDVVKSIPQTVAQFGEGMEYLHGQNPFGLFSGVSSAVGDALKERWVPDAYDLLPNSGKNFMTLGEDEDVTLEERDALFTTDDILYGINAQKEYIANNGVPERGSPGYPEFLKLVKGISEIEEMATSGDDIEHQIGARALMQNEAEYVKYVNAREGLWETNQEDFQIQDQPYHTWEREHTNQTFRDILDYQKIKANSDFEEAVNKDPQLKALKNWNENSLPDESTAKKMGEVTADGLIQYIQAGGVGLASASGALTTYALTRNPAALDVARKAFQAGFVGTFGVKEFLGAMEEGTAYLTADKPISEEQYQTMMALEREAINKKDLTDSQKEQSLDLYERSNFTDVYDAQGNVTRVLQGLHAGDAWFAQSTSVYAGTAFTMWTENLSFNAISKMFGNKGHEWVGKKFANNLMPKITSTIRSIPGSKKMSRIASLHSGTWGPLFYGSMVEGTEEGIQYLGQIAAQTNPLFGYKDESFSDEFDWGEFGMSVWGGLSVGGVLGGTGSLYQNTDFGRRIDNWKIASNKSDFMRSYSQYNKETGKYDVMASSPVHKLDVDTGDYIIDSKTGMPTIEGVETNVISSHTKFSDSYKAASSHNRKFTAFVNSQSPTILKEYIDAKTRIIKNKDGTYKLVIVKKDGNPVKVMNFEKHEDVINYKATEDNTISMVNARAQHDSDLAKRAEETKSIIKYDEDGKTILSLDEDALFLSGVYGGDGPASLSTNDELNAFEEMKGRKDYKKNIANPKRLIEIIERRGWNVLNAINMSKSELMSTLNDEYAELYPEDVQKIDDLLVDPIKEDAAEVETTQVPEKEDIPEREVVAEREDDIIELEDDVRERIIEEDVMGRDDEPIKRDERYKKLSDDDVKAAYLKSKAKKDITSTLETSRLRTELKARGLEAPKTPKKKETKKKEEKKTTKSKVVVKFTSAEEQAVNIAKAEEFLKSTQDEDKQASKMSNEELESTYAGLKFKARRDKGSTMDYGNKYLALDAEMRKRGLIEKVSKQRISDALKKAAAKEKQEVLDSYKKKQKKKTDFVKGTLEFLKKKFVDKNGKQIFKYKILSEEDQGKKENQFKGKIDWDSNTVIINPKFLSEDTGFHEISHPFIRAISQTEGGLEIIDSIYNEIIGSKAGQKIYNKILKRYVEKEDGSKPDFKEGSYEFKEEVIAEALGKAARDSKRQPEFRQLENPIIQAVKSFWNALKRLLLGKDADINLNTYDFVKDGVTLKDLVDFLTDEQQVLTISGIKNKVKEQVSLQRIENPRLANNAAINRIFQEAWLDINILNNKETGIKANVHPERFRKAMIRALTGTGLEARFDKWFQSRFGEYGDIKWKNNAEGKDTDSMLPQDETGQYILSYLTDMDNREGGGLESLIDRQETNEKELSSGDFNYLSEFGIKVPAELAKEINRRAFEIIEDSSIPNDEKFTIWLKESLGKVGKRYNQLLPFNKRRSLKKWNRLFSAVTINSEAGRLNNRDNFYVLTETEAIIEDDIWLGSKVVKMTIKPKGPKNLITKGKNNDTDKTTPFEMNNEEGLVTWVNGKDFLEWKKRKEDWEYDTEFESIEPEESRWNSRFNFFTYDELVMLEEQLNKKDYTIVMSKGDSDKLAIVAITEEHKKKALAIEAYVDKEIELNIIDKNKRESSINALSEGNIAANITAHETLKKVFPNYLTYFEAHEVGKRFKLPFTPMTISNTMPDVDIYIANKDNLTFKYDGKEWDGTYKIRTKEGIRKVYIGDGGSITARKLFKKFEKHHGLVFGQAKAKTVIYQNKDGKGIAIKHQHYQVEPLMEIWEGDVLIAKVDANGNFIEGIAKGKDMIVTKDEAKWMYGIDVGSSITVSGQSIGFTKYADEKISNNANHMMQWYNHVTDPAIIDVFKRIVLNKIKTNTMKIYGDFSDGRTKGAAERISKVVSKIDINSPVGFKSSLVELNKLGFIWQLEPMLSVLYQNKKVNPNLQIKENEGTQAELVPNLRGDLERGEVALSKHNATEVLRKYATANDVSIAQANREIDKVNAWLLNNPVHMHASRSPVPHIGGTMMVRVKRLYNRKGTVEMNVEDVFARLEGDFDGDWISLEMLPWTYENEQFVSEMDDIYLDFFERLGDIEGINLDKYDKKVSKLNMLRRKDRFKLTESMTFNVQANIVNIQTLHGTLSQTIESFTVDGNNIVVKSPDEIRETPMTINGKRVKLPVSKILRIYVQAAVDNIKYGLLQTWNYNQEELERSLFKYGKGHPKEGKNISKEHFYKLKPYIKFLKQAATIRRGKDFNTNFNMTQVIELSEDYYSYTQDKEGYVNNKEWPIFRNNKGKVHTKGTLQIKLKTKELTPAEEIAIVPYEQYVNWMKRDNIIGTEGSPIRLNYNVHRNAHDTAIEYLNEKEIVQEYLNRALVKDKIEEDKAKAYIKEEWTKGRMYAVEMGKMFYDIIEANIKNNKGESHNPNYMEFNEAIVFWKQKFDKVYKDISEVAKVAATYRFLSGMRVKEQGKGKTQFSSKAARWLPPASNSETEFQLLHEDVLTEFAEIYNEQVAENRNTKNKFKKVEHLIIEETVEDMCK